MSELSQDGYCVFPNILGETECDALIRALPDTPSAGSRRLLEMMAIQEAASQLRDNPALSEYLHTRHAIQCIYFRKDQEKNWSVSLHRDTAFPIDGEGSWKSAGRKEGVKYVRPPAQYLKALLAVRLSLDCVAEGNLNVVPGSHRSDIRPSVDGAVTVQVPKGGVLAMSPLLYHSSSKLVTSVSRRVLHFVFAPPTLEYQYRWYHSV